MPLVAWRLEAARFGESSLIVMVRLTVSPFFAACRSAAIETVGGAVSIETLLSTYPPVLTFPFPAVSVKVLSYTTT